MKHLRTAILLAALVGIVGCTAREALIGVGGVAVGAAAGAYAADKYDVDVDERDD